MVRIVEETFGPYVPLWILIMSPLVFFIVVTIILYYLKINWKILGISTIVSAIGWFWIQTIGRYIFRSHPNMLLIGDILFLLILISTVMLYILIHLIKRKKKNK